MLNLACRNTNKLIRERSREENVRLGRLFTKKDTARRMADMLTLDPTKTAYTILDPGAGTGILSAALIERICREVPACRQIFVTCYETEQLFLPMLADNLERIRRKCRHDYDVKLFVTIFDENYVVDSKNHYTVTFSRTLADTFDLIVCHPPCALLEKSSEEAESAGGVTQVKISEAYLFAKMAAGHLEPEGQLVILLPTVAATAAQLTPFRRYMHERLSLRAVHLFIGVQKNVKRAVPLKKNMILCFAAGEAREDITITTSTDAGTPARTVMLPPLSYAFVVDKTDGSLTLPKSVEDTNIVRYIGSFQDTLAGLGLKIATGRILDARCRELLFNDAAKGLVPLFRPCTIQGGRVEFPGTQQKNPAMPAVVAPHQYIAPVTANLVQRNKNMIFIKRVFSKSDERFINAGVHLAGSLPAYPYISTHNKILFIDTKNVKGEMSARFAYGLFALLNSTIYDRYISIVSKSKQVNAKEMRDLPLPPANIIENIGMRLMAMRVTTVAACDSIVNPTLHIIDKSK